MIAYRLLFGIYSGIVPDGIDDLVTGDIDWAGDSVILLSYVKGRTAAESLNLPRQAVRLLEQWLAHSALLRSHAGPEHRRDLWLRLNKPGGTRIWAKGGAAGRVAVQRWIARPRGDRRRRPAAEDPPVPDPHHAPVDAGQADLGRPRPGDHRPQPLPGSRRRPLPDGHHAVPAAGRRGDRRGRPARPAAPGPPAGGDLRRGRRLPGPRLSRAGRLARTRRHGDRRARRRGTGRVHRGLRRPAVRACTGRRASPARPGRGSACSARWRCSPRGTPRTCCG